MLDMFTHAGLRDPTATEDLHGIPSDILCGARNVHLQQRYRSARSQVQWYSVVSAPAM